MKFLSHFLSWVFHPLLITTWLVAFLGFFYPQLLGINPAVVLRFILFVMLITFIFPALNIALMIKLSGPGASLQMPARKQRIAPFILISIIYCFFAGLFIYKDILGSTFTHITAIIAAVVLIGTILTLFYKVSIHSMAMGAVSGILVGLNRLTGGILFYPAVICIIICGLVMTARLALNAHTPREALSGGLVGFATGITGMLILFR